MKTFIIGFGRMGKLYLKVCQNLSLDVVGIYDIAPQASENIEVQNISELKADLEKVEPDLVLIASTATSHCYYLQLCVTAGVPHVMVEKPLGTSLSELEELCLYSKKHDEKTRIAVNHQMRYMAQYAGAKELIEKGNFGEVQSISVVGGNMGLSMNGTHYFEMFRYFVGEYPQKVWGWLSPQDTVNPRGIEYKDDAGCIRLETKSGKRFYMDISSGQGHGIFLTLTCSFGQIQIDELDGRIYASCRKNKKDLLLPTTRYGLESYVETFDIVADDLLPITQSVLEALLQNSDYPTFYDGLFAVKTLVAAHASSDNNHSMIDIDHIPEEYKNKKFPWA